MKINQDKCHVLFTGNTPESIWVKVGEEIIWENNQVKLLGITIDKNLKFESHLSKLCAKVSSKVTILSRMGKLLPREKKKILMKAFIESQFSYCPLIWMFCSRKLNNRINFIHERALRLVYDDYENSFEYLLKQDNSVSIHHRNIQRVAIEMYKVVHKLCPSIMNDLFVPHTTTRQTRSKRAFIRPRVNSVHYGEYSIRSFGPIVWDEMLPQHLKEAINLNIFKKYIKNWIPDNCPCNLCKVYVPQLGFVTLTE